MAIKQRLGRGLGNLIAGGISLEEAPPKKSKSLEPVPQDASPEAQASKAVAEVSIEKIQSNPHQPRKSFSEESLQELADSIRSEGLLQPVVVRKKGDKYQLIAGERRLRACKLLGLKMIPTRIMEATDASSAVIALIENLQREDLNPIDEALGFSSLMNDFSLTQEAVAQRIGKARASVANALRLLQLSPEVQGYISRKMLSVGHAKVILGLSDKTQQSLLARKIIEEGMSVRQAEKAIKAFLPRSLTSITPPPIRPATQSVIHSIEKQMTGFLNTKVRLKHTPKRGSILIEYYGDDDLKRIMDKIGLS